MHCPRCGADALSGQQFCRSCGFNLEQVAELLDQQPSVSTNANLVRARLHQRRLEHWAGVGGLALMSFVLLTVVYLVVSEMMIKGGHIGAGLAFLFVILGAAVMAGLKGYSKALKQRLATQSAPAIMDLAPAPTKQLEPHLEPAQSVTEHTTELLPVRPAQPRINTKEI
jgi:hypothetical protein